MAGHGEQAAPEPVRRRDGKGRFAPTRVRIGVLGDTHGRLDPLVLELFAGVDHIIHAGDVMDAGILDALAGIAPLTAVAGNLDHGALAGLPKKAAGEAGCVRFVVSHKPKRLLKRLASGKLVVGEDGSQPDLVVWGRLHTPTAEWVEGTLLLNPGTASSPDEEDDGPTVAIVEKTPTGLAVQFLPLERQPPFDSRSRTAR
jgi:putative phosphoesterase